MILLNKLGGQESLTKIVLPRIILMSYTQNAFILVLQIFYTFTFSVNPTKLLSFVNAEYFCFLLLSQVVKSFFQYVTNTQALLRKLEHGENQSLTPGVNFINVLHTAFALVDSKSIKNTVKSSVCFYAFGIYERKSCTQDVDEIEPRFA